MKAEAQEGQQRSSRDVLWVWFCWLGLFVMLYVLSVGPVMKISDKMNISNPHPAARFFTSFSKPLEWAYNETLLHKPLGLYYHLWIPSIIDSKGNVIQK